MELTEGFGSPNLLKINNSKKAAVKSKWKDNGAALYQHLLNAIDYGGSIPDSGLELDHRIKQGKYKSWHDFLKEAYLIAPVKNIKNSPYGVTPFNRSGCLYPHHNVKDGELVLNIEGLKKAYDKAFRDGVLRKGGDRGAMIHMTKHLKELGIEIRHHHGQLHFIESTDEEESESEISYENVKQESFLEEYCLEHFCPDISAIFIESTTDAGEIREVKHEDVTSAHVKKWFLKMKDWQRVVDPSQFTFDEITHNPSINRFVYGYFIDGNLEGFIRIQDHVDEYRIAWFYINPVQQSNGYGQILFKHILSMFGNKTLVLNVECGNKSAIHIYEKYGFVIKGAFIGSVKYFRMERPPVSLEEPVEKKKNPLAKIVDVLDENFKYIENFIGESLDIDMVHYEKYGTIKPYPLKDPSIDDGKPIEYDKEFIPVFGIVKSSFTSSPFGKVVRTLTRGDVYQHALISMDDSFTNMISFNDDGLENVNILTHPKYQETDTIYITVMFVTPREKKLMDNYIKFLEKHKEETVYASENLLKVVTGRTTKNDKRFICSAIVGYLLNKGNLKNLHRDYSKIRPEDITILPRAFYVMNVKDGKEFKQKQNELRRRVNKLYQDNYEEILDYNNHLPKLMMKEKFKKLNMFDKFLDWIIG